MSGCEMPSKAAKGRYKKAAPTPTKAPSKQNETSPKNDRKQRQPPSTRSKIADKNKVEDNKVTTRNRKRIQEPESTWDNDENGQLQSPPKKSKNSPKKGAIKQEDGSYFPQEHGYSSMSFDIKQEPVDHNEDEENDADFTIEKEDVDDEINADSMSDQNSMEDSETREEERHKLSNNNHNDLEKTIKNVRRELHCSSFNMYVPLLELYNIPGNRDISDETTSLSGSAKCPVCHENAADKQAMHKHVIENHPNVYGLDLTLDCPGCDLSFDSLPLLDQHLALENSANQALKVTYESTSETCRFCDTFRMRDRSAMLWHESTKHSEEFLLSSRFKCSMCNRHFTHFEECREHILKRECLNLCTGCKKVFPLLHLLAEHINKKHLLQSRISLTTVNCMACINCGFRVRTLDQFVGHICPKYCQLCDVTFSAYSLYYNHLWQVHYNWGGLCDSCRVVFDDKEIYANHMKHRICEKCRFCQFSFKDVLENVQHKCILQSLPAVTYSIHVPAPKELKLRRSPAFGEVPCILCGSVFKSVLAYQNHLGEGNSCFGCRLCEHVTESKSTLIQHVLHEHSNENLHVSSKEENAKDEQNLVLPSGNENFRAVKDIDGFCVLCRQIVISEADLEENHKATFKCIECSKVMRCKVNFVKHIASAHSSTCDICKKHFDYLSLHTLKRHSAEKIPLEQPVSLYSCSKCNVHSFDLQVLVKKADPKKCQHIRSLWQFDL